MTKDAVIDVIHKTIYGFFDLVADDSEEPMSEKDKLLLEVNKAVCNAIMEMPNEKRKVVGVGKWIEKDGWDGDVYYDCSVCGESWTTIEGTPWDNGMNYCPNCGAKMEGAE